MKQTRSEWNLDLTTPGAIAIIVVVILHLIKVISFDWFSGLCIGLFFFSIRIVNKVEKK